jgi:hypothetical protein
LENAKYPDGKSVALIAALNEYGVPSRNQPPRPFLRNMIAKYEKDWPKAIAGLLKSTDYNVDQTLMLTGEAIKGQLQQSIRDLTSPLSAQLLLRVKASTSR